MRQKRVFSVNFSITAERREERLVLVCCPVRAVTLRWAGKGLRDANGGGSPVPLTSPQGVLSILGHGVGFIQDDELEAFP